MTNKDKRQVSGSSSLPKLTSAPLGQLTIDNALRYDALASYPDKGDLYTKYIEANRLGYYTVMNTWYLLLMEYTGCEIPEIKQRFNEGLLPSIKEAKLTADAVIRQEELPVNVFTYALYLRADHELTGEEMRKCLQVLRYPKRFTPFVTDWLADKEINEFLNRNNKAKMLNRREIPFWLAERLKEVINDVLAGYWPTRRHQYFTCWEALPKGTTAEGARTIAQKVKTIEAKLPLYFYPYVGESRATAIAPSVNYCNGTTVPKSAEARRVIAEEECDRQIEMWDEFEELDWCLATSNGKYGTKGRVLLHDQSRNQEMARIGSITGRLATVDMHAASDSVTAQLVRTVFPPDIVRRWDILRSDEIRFKAKRVKLHLYSTMGSRLTFHIESTTFWAIAVVSTEDAARWLDVPFCIDDISVYGDDCIVPAFAYETFVCYLGMCGFTVNIDKSYADGLYRESCGMEFYAGYEISSEYYPRRPVDLFPDGGCEVPEPNAIVQLIELQHRLFSHRSVNTFLQDLVLSLNKNVTFSSVGSVHSDLWSQYAPITTKAIKRYTIEHSYDSLGRLTSRSLKCLGDSEYVHECHTTVTTVYKVTSDYDTAERCAYIDFLMNGPMYATPLDQLLGVSTRRDPKAYQSSGKAKMVRLLS